ncbi:Protein kinase-like domain containing protein [Parasponia andersonii]|uniref:Protein kinase-like domain containing protein n=1 Tax=Parasponia andersonii TaxID=3476 RepID=A0A2P5B4R5_PARAD|nr:Protein kinase-like domain containing protein [Parasponia andersonii]
MTSSCIPWNIVKAWELWTSDRGLDLMDPSLEDQSAMHMILRYVHVALLCVQESAVNRPNMSQVVMMLSNSSQALPYPQQPDFLSYTTTVNPNQVQSRPEAFSFNDVTLLIIEAR